MSWLTSSRARARVRGFQVLWGRCHETGGAPAYWPWVQIIRAYLPERDPQLLMSDMGAGAAAISAEAPNTTSQRNLRLADTIRRISAPS